VHRYVVKAKRSDAPGPAGLFIIGLFGNPSARSSHRPKMPQWAPTAARPDKRYKQAPSAILNHNRKLPCGQPTGRPRPEVPTVMMTMEKAQKIIEAGIVKAKEIDQPMNIAVVDLGANLTAFMRMDGAWLGSIDIAINKAFTAKAFDISTLEGRRIQMNTD
jgi:hypothetical protein